jgi:hypothetical protein
MKKVQVFRSEADEALRTVLSDILVSSSNVHEPDLMHLRGVEISSFHCMQLPYTVILKKSISNRLNLLFSEATKTIVVSQVRMLFASLTRL